MSVEAMVKAGYNGEACDSITKDTSSALFRRMARKDSMDAASAESVDGVWYNQFLTWSRSLEKRTHDVIRSSTKFWKAKMNGDLSCFWALAATFSPLPENPASNNVEGFISKHCQLYIIFE